jgi:hypothetical protein
MTTHDANARTSPRQPGRSLTITLPPTGSHRQPKGGAIEHIGPMGFDPPDDLIDVESDELSDLDERDTTLIDQTSDVTDADAQMNGQRVDVNQRWEAIRYASRGVFACHEGPFRRAATTGQSRVIPVTE